MSDVFSHPFLVGSVWKRVVVVVVVVVVMVVVVVVGLGATLQISSRKMFYLHKEKNFNKNYNSINPRRTNIKSRGGNLQATTRQYLPVLPCFGDLAYSWAIELPVWFL